MIFPRLRQVLHGIPSKGLRDCPKKVTCLSSSHFSTATEASKGEEEKLWMSSPIQNLQPITGVTVPEYVRANQGKWADKVAFECYQSGRKYTHKQVMELSRGFGAALIQAGFKKGDVIGVVAPNIPEYCSILYGIWEAGLVATTINWGYTSYEIERQLTHSGAKGVVTIPEFLPSVEKVKVSSPNLMKFVVVVHTESHQDCHSFFQMAKTDPRFTEFPTGSQIDTTKETVLLPYSSGTTGAPKGVMLTHTNILTNFAVQLLHPKTEHCQRPCTETFQERVIANMPFYHMYGVAVGLIVGMLVGSRQLVIPKFDTATYIRYIKEHKPTTLFTVPPILSLLIQNADLKAEDLRETDHILAGAAPVGTELITPILEKYGEHIIFQEAWGMTECTTIATLLPLHTRNSKAGSAGVPPPLTKTKIISPITGQTLGRNEKGEICIKGPQIMKGYLNNEEATRATIDSEGWLHSGDIGYYDDDGYIYIVDRLKELIKVNAFQVSPAELEDVIRGHPKVADVAVIGIPHPRKGEAPKAYVVAKAGAGELKPEEVSHFLVDKVAKFKQLAEVEVIPAIPKSPSGKILRRELVEDHKKKNSS